jgi:hypothetical protein
MAQVLLLHCDGGDGSTTFTDSSPSAHTVNAFGNAQVNDANPKFGSGAALFDGLGTDYLSVGGTTSDWDFGIGEFTIECWVKTTNVSTQGGLQRRVMQCGASGWFIHHGTPGSGITFYSGAINYHSGVDINDGSWHHIAVTRDNTNTLRIFIDGVALVTVVDTSNVTPGANLTIGRHPIANGAWDGEIDEVLILKGTCLYNGDFTPPTSPYGDIIIHSVEQINYLEYDGGGKAHYPGTVKVVYTLN